MELPIIIILWTLVPTVPLALLMLCVWLGAKADLAKAQMVSEQKLHG